MEPKKPNPFDVEVNHILTHLNEQDPSSEEYKMAVDSLKVLVEAKYATSIQLPWNEIIKAGAYLTATLLVINRERVDIITSKAFGWIRFS